MTSVKSGPTEPGLCWLQAAFSGPFEDASGVCIEDSFFIKVALPGGPSRKVVQLGVESTVEERQNGRPEEAAQDEQHQHTRSLLQPYYRRQGGRNVSSQALVQI